MVGRNVVVFFFLNTRFCFSFCISMFFSYVCRVLLSVAVMSVSSSILQKENENMFRPAFARRSCFNQKSKKIGRFLRVKPAPLPPCPALALHLRTTSLFFSHSYVALTLVHHASTSDRSLSPASCTVVRTPHHVHTRSLILSLTIMCVCVASRPAAVARSTT